MADLTLDLATINAPDGPLIIVATGRDDDARAATAHRHARGQLFASLRGLLTVGVETSVWIVPTIHAVWLPPHHLHWAHTHGAFEGWSAYIAEEACRDLPDRPCTLRTSALLRAAVLRAATWQPGPLDAPSARLAGVILDEIRALPVEPFGLPLPQDPRLQRIADALIADPADERGLEAWADWAVISMRTLSRRFVVETGFSFTAWRQRVRLLRALELLAAATPVTTVALDLGYSNVSAFISLFRRTFGVTPGEYMRNAEQTANTAG